MTTLQMLSTIDIENLIRDHSPAKSTLQSVIIGGLQYELKAREYDEFSMKESDNGLELSKEDSDLIEAIENL